MHKNQVALIKLKSSSPLVVKVQQYVFMKTLTYIKFFFPVAPNTICFSREANSPFTLWSIDSFFSSQLSGSRLK